MKDIICIIVSYQAMNLLKECVDSLRKVHPELKILIVDGSIPGSKCYEYVRGIRDKNIRKVQVEYNIGHGNGMRLGINMTTEKYILLCDSDVVVKKDCITTMHAIVDAKTYGVGQVVKVNAKGENCKNGFDYLHPHFAMISRAQYYAHQKFIHHGAPLIKTMNEINKRKSARLKNFPVSRFVIHKERGTRALNPKEFDSKTWER